MPRRWLALVALAAVGSVGGCARRVESAAREAEVAVPLRVERGELRQRVLLSGTLAAEDAVALIAPNVSIWPLQLRWVVEDGAEVKAGDVVVELDNAQLASQLEGLRAAALEARGRFDATAARVAGEVAAVELERMRATATLAKARLDAEVPEGLISPKQLEERRRDLRKAELELAEAETKLEAKRTEAKAAIEIERVALEKATLAVERAEIGVGLLSLEAPRDGVVVLGEEDREGRPLRAGDNVWPGATLARLPDLRSLRVEAQLFDVDDGAVTPGLAVEATLDAFPERRFAGSIAAVEATAAQLGRRSQRRAFRVLVELDDIDPELMRPGMSVKVEAALPPRSGLLVPRRAIEWQGAEPRLVLASGERLRVVLGPCDPHRCLVDEGPSEGTVLGEGRS